MIDEMGMKGEKRGGAVVSPVHANFIVTEGDDARASDAFALAEEIRERIRRERGIELEYEVELWRSGNSNSALAAGTNSVEDGTGSVGETMKAQDATVEDEGDAGKR